MQALQAVNRNIATSGKPADSRRFMDLMEEATGKNMDNLFLVWVFPDSYGQVLADRREARDRLGRSASNVCPMKDCRTMSSRPSRPASISGRSTRRSARSRRRPRLAWRLTLICSRKLSIASDQRRRRRARACRTSIATALNHFDFETRPQTTSPPRRDAVTAYTAADAKVHEGRRSLDDVRAAG